jgi:uncharacterized 2Fe-2S/4Fe-4S cluster protein (DUF4445 family)
LKMPERNASPTPPFTVTFPALDRRVPASAGDNLLELMRVFGIAINADCGGAGTCGKCQVEINGTRQLACLTNIVSDTEVYLFGEPSDEGFSIVTDCSGAGRTHPPSATSAQKYAIAIDLGTTTVVGKLVDVSTGYELASFAQINSQRAFGADIMSRISAALQDASPLTQLITEQIDRAIVALLRDADVESSDVEQVVIAANTAMTYLLLGWPCRSLGAAPFTPEFPVEPPYSYERIFGRATLSCDCDVLPPLSAFVGGDLTAGLCMLHGEDDFILMDLGTNGEMIFKRGDRLICTATAAGPAFEGAAIECGSGSVRGAISSVWLEGESLAYRTIDDAAARGICGSGILDLMAVLLGVGLVDTTGAMAEPDKVVPAFRTRTAERVIVAPGSPMNNFAEVYFSQKDVRQFQLAKSAIRTGLEIIIEEMGGGAPSKLFLAGGFGQNLSAKSAALAGLLPRELERLVIPVGNSSLGGAVKVCFDSATRNEVVAQIGAAEEINLATHPRFGELFMEHMSF